LHWNGPGQAEITGVTLRCNPLVPELMGRVQPGDGLGAAATAPEVARLRSLITLDVDPAVPRDAAVLRVSPGSGPPPGEVAADRARAQEPGTPQERL
jgi:hypothetical protein